MTASLLLHGGWMLTLGPARAPRAARAGAPVAYHAAFEAQPAAAEPLVPVQANAATLAGGPQNASALDLDQPAGRGGERAAPEPATLLFSFASPLTLQDTELNNLAASQTQRIETARSRATQEERRATPHAAAAVFLASGAGGHRERRAVARVDARDGAQRGRGEESSRGSAAAIASAARAPDERSGADRSAQARPLDERSSADRSAQARALDERSSADRSAQARERAEHVTDARSAHGAQAREEDGNRSEAAPSAGERSEEASANRARSARGILRGSGEHARPSARVAHARPNVDPGPAATPAETLDPRVRDNADAELLAAALQRSIVDSSTQRAEQRGPGVGGVDDPAAAGLTRAGSGRGARALPYLPGLGDASALDTRDARYLRWFVEQKERVQNELTFPKARALNKDQGVSIYRVVVRRDGQLAGAPHLVRSSGYEDFDQAAVLAIRRAVPFSPLPERLLPEAADLTLLIPVAFSNPLVQ